jgi:uncharacterized repeat protein (TIGR01451 family)
VSTSQEGDDNFLRALVTQSFAVNYDFVGCSDPVSPPPTLNLARAGRRRTSTSRNERSREASAIPPATTTKEIKVTTRSISLLIAAAVAAAGCTDQPLPSGAPDPAPRFAFAGDNGKIVFTSDRAGDPDVWIMDANGSNPANLTRTLPGSTHLPTDQDPVWSPDGTRIAFASDRDQFGNLDIYVMNADGTDVERLTDDAADDVEPSWSPNGNSIAFTSDRTGDAEIFVVSTDVGDTPVNLTNSPSLDIEPAWSPDGSKIAFTTDRDSEAGGELDIHVMNADGTGTPVNLTDRPGEPGAGAQDHDAAWSPDGDDIAFTRFQNTTAGTDIRVWVMDADGTDQNALTDGATADSKPAWSPDGELIAFTRVVQPTVPAEVFVVNTDGTGATNLTNHAAHDDAPDWQPVPPPGADLAIAITAGAVSAGGTVTFTITVVNRGPAVAEGVVVTDPLPGEIQFLGAEPSSGTCSVGSDGTVVCALGDLDAGASATIALSVRVLDGSEFANTASVTSDTGDPNLANNSATAPLHPRGIDQLAFHSDRDDQLDIHRMNADGTGRRRLSEDEGTDRNPVWSPDGSRVAFESDREHGTFDIHVMDANGNGETNLTNHPAGDINPAWSPDGSRIAFISGRDSNTEIYVMNFDGTGLTNLTNSPEAEHALVWSPDGTRIGFVRERNFNLDIFVMNADGSGQVALTNDLASDFDPAWSPNGSRITFNTFRDGNWEIYVMNPDGTGQINITNHPATDLEPEWSPDGSRLVFRSERHGNAEIHVMNADGSGQKRLTTDPQFDQCPTWSPDGKLIAFTRTGSFIDIHVTKANGKNQTNLTNSTEVIINGCPVWRP